MEQLRDRVGDKMRVSMLWLAIPETQKHLIAFVLPTIFIFRLNHR
jgi:hypothetical protein